MITIGVDYHKKTSSFHVLDEKGKTIKRAKIINDTNDLITFITSFNEPKRLAMEATRSWNLFHRTIRDHVDEFQLGHPLKMKMITESSTKTDKNDARAIAELAHMGYLPQAYISTDTEQSLRNLVRYRGQLVNHRRRIKQYIHALIDRNLWPTQKPQSFKNIFCKRGITWLQQLGLEPNDRFILDQHLIHLEKSGEKITLVESELNKQNYALALFSYLRTVPGFVKGGINTYCVLIEAGDIRRFKNANGFIHYTPQEKKIEPDGLLKMLICIYVPLSLKQR